MKSTELRPGMAVILDGNLYVITKFVHATPGNLRAFVQLKLRNVANGTYIEKRLRAGEEIETTSLDRRQVEYLYSDSTGHVFMDQESYDQVVISDAMISEEMSYVRPNATITVLINQEKPVAIELPNSVELVVAETTPQVKGATATNQLKEATMETGLKIRVPSFIEAGETLRISCADGSYLGRA